VSASALLRLFHHLAGKRSSIDHEDNTKEKRKEEQDHDDRNEIVINREGLLSVDLARCIRVTDEVIAQGLASCFPGQLQVVNLSRCSKVTDSSVISLLTSCRESLRELNFFGCSKLTNAIWAPLSDCTNLRNLCLSRCFQLSDDVLPPHPKYSSLSLSLTLSFIYSILGIKRTNVQDDESLHRFGGSQSSPFERDTRYRIEANCLVRNLNWFILLWGGEV